VADVANIILDSQPWPDLLNLIAAWMKAGDGPHRVCSLRMLSTLGEYVSSQVIEADPISQDLLQTITECLRDGSEGGAVRASASAAACQLLRFLPSSRWEDWAGIWPELLGAVRQLLQAGSTAACDILDDMAETVGYQVSR